MSRLLEIKNELAIKVLQAITPNELNEVLLAGIRSISPLLDDPKELNEVLLAGIRTVPSGARSATTLDTTIGRTNNGGRDQPSQGVRLATTLEDPRSASSRDATIIDKPIKVNGRADDGKLIKGYKAEAERELQEGSFMDEQLEQAKPILGKAKFQDNNIKQAVRDYLKPEENQFKYGPISTWDTSEVTTMQGIFRDASDFNEDLRNWDVSNVTNMARMFSGAESFNGDLSAWRVNKVTDMSLMFHNAKSFSSDLRSWNVSQVKRMTSMFQNAHSFNSDLSAWNVSNVTNMAEMFSKASTFNGGLRAWNVTNVTNMTEMFYKAESLNGDLSTWQVGNVVDMRFMFAGATSFNSDLSEWDVSSVTAMRLMFASAYAFNGDISAWKPLCYPQGVPLKSLQQTDTY